MQCHNLISDVYNKPNRLKIGLKLSKLWLFKRYMYHYQHNAMGEWLTVARWPPVVTLDSIGQQRGRAI